MIITRFYSIIISIFFNAVFLFVLLSVLLAVLLSAKTSKAVKSFQTRFLNSTALLTSFNSLESESILSGYSFCKDKDSLQIGLSERTKEG